MTKEQIEALIAQLGPEAARTALKQLREEAAAEANRNPAKKFSAMRDTGTFGSFVKAIAAHGKGADLATAAKRFGGEDMAKAVQEQNYESAGVLVPVQNSSEIIEYLRPISLFDKLKARFVPFKSELTIPKQTGTGSLTWIGEGDTVAESKPSFGKIVLKAHKAMALMNLSNDMLRNPDVATSALVGEDCRQFMAHGLDDAALNGDGNGYTPKGLLTQVNAANIFVKSGAYTTVTNAIADVDKAERLVKEANLDLDDSTAWLMSPSKEAELKGLRDGAGYVFRDEMKDGTLNGRPFVVSTRAPTARLILGVWSQFLFGIDQDLELSTHADTRAAYDETVMRAILRADFKIRQDKAFAVIKDS